MNRRTFIKQSAGLVAAGAMPLLMQGCSKQTASMGRVVVIGGGYAGATVAKYIRMWSEGAIEVVVIEANQQFVSCPMSNLVLGGSKSINDLTFEYGVLQKNYGIQWVTDTVTNVDAEKKRITLKQAELTYDRLVIAPGIDFVYDEIPNLQSIEAQEKVPHAWKAGWQTVRLRQQLEAMPNGGTFAMHIPKGPYRCPPGPYERAAQVASYFKSHKPQSKVIVLDTNPDIVSKKGLFEEVFSKDYADIIDYRPNQALTEVDVATKSIVTDFDQVKADVLNVIPPQRAGKVAQQLKLTNIDGRWCEVDFLTYESAVINGIHVIGDAVSAALPKSAHMASSQAKVCANAIVQLMSGAEVDPEPMFSNTCYSFVNAQEAIHVAAIYRYDPEKQSMINQSGGLSKAPSTTEAEYALNWANNIWADTLT